MRTDSHTGIKDQVGGLQPVTHSLPTKALTAYKVKMKETQEARKRDSKHPLLQCLANWSFTDLQKKTNGDKWTTYTLNQSVLLLNVTHI